MNEESILGSLTKKKGKRAIHPQTTMALFRKGQEKNKN